MNRTTRALVLAAVIAAAGCSDGTTIPEPVAAGGSTPSEQQTSAPTVGPDVAEPPVPTTAPVPDSPPTMSASSTDPLLEPVPETGIPGLDSEDVFCAAWSRFGGTWQVLSVGSAFLEDPTEVAEWEVAAAQVVHDAFDDLVAAFPPELADEQDIAVDGFFGVLNRRAAVARSALGDAGANAGDVDRLGRAWVDALAVRDQFDADIHLEIPTDLRPIVEAAAQQLLDDRGPFHLDPTMIVAADTPATDDYLAVACPDRGALAGQEVGGGAGDGDG